MREAAAVPRAGCAALQLALAVTQPFGKISLHTGVKPLRALLKRT